ncbi:unnamed protein product [Cyprideis torosa]|uniref:Uncharacterized protein n=1 Tax=Cyprideis torosa TaxID=163714 RepID=A0A7R8WKZ6_9CRUS|nr:unnamed protein product [Cyprideis torosa]CAG0897452.1 unnamed protein product [Cyprideis torosa]
MDLLLFGPFQEDAHVLTKPTLLAKLGRQESVTLEGFRNSYHFMDQRIGDHIRVFFTRLQDFIEEKPDAKSIQDSVQEFFDAIFPLIFHNILAEKKPFESTYSTCLSMNRLKSNPFDKVPLEMTRSLTKTLQTSRTFTTALTDVERLLDDIKMIPFSVSCQDALVRMALCPRCAGHDPAAPCPGFCLNVARGCLTSLAYFVAEDGINPVSRAPLQCRHTTGNSAVIQLYRQESRARPRMGP